MEKSTNMTTCFSPQILSMRKSAKAGLWEIFSGKLSAMMKKSKISEISESLNDYCAFITG